MPDNKSASFEASLARLQEIVTDLEREGIDLERAVALFDEGRTLVAQCEKLLASAEERLRQGVAAADAPPATAEADEAPETEDIPF
jgi:exodeoxyribonuclease VII small subunit